VSDSAVDNTGAGTANQTGQTSTATEKQQSKNKTTQLTSRPHATYSSPPHPNSIAYSEACIQKTLVSREAMQTGRAEALQCRPSALPSAD